MQDQVTASAQPGQAPERERRRKPYRVAEVAAVLDVHQSTIYRDIEVGRLRALRVGTGRGALRVPQWAFDEYLAVLEAGARVTPAEGVAR